MSNKIIYCSAGKYLQKHKFLYIVTILCIQGNCRHLVNNMHRLCIYPSKGKYIFLKHFLYGTVWYVHFYLVFFSFFSILHTNIYLYVFSIQWQCPYREHKHISQKQERYREECYIIICKLKIFFKSFTSQTKRCNKSYFIQICSIVNVEVEFEISTKVLFITFLSASFSYDTKYVYIYIHTQLTQQIYVI